MHDAIDRCMRGCVRWPSPVDLGAGHIVVRARSICKQCLTDRQRVVQVDNGRSEICRGRVAAMFCRALGKQGMDWTLRAENWIKDRNVIHIQIMCRRWACQLMNSFD